MAAKAQIIDFLLAGYRNPSDDTPLAGGTVDVTLAGTSTTAYVWDDRDKTLPTVTGRSTVTLDAYGKAEVYGDGVYKFVIKDSTGATVETIDYVEYQSTSSYITNLSSDTPTSGKIATWDGLPWRDVREYADLDDAITNIGATETVLNVSTEVTVGADAIIPETLAIKVDKGGSFAIGAGFTLTINGALEAGHYQIFSGAGTVLIRDAVETDYMNPHVQEIKADWFDLSTGWAAATQAAVLAGGSKACVVWPAGRRLPWGDVSLDLSEDTVGRHISIRGAGFLNTEFVVPAAAGGGAGIVAIDTDPVPADGSNGSELAMADFRIIEDTGSQVSTLIRLGGTSVTFQRIFIGNADKGIYSEGGAGHHLDDIWIESCKMGIDYDCTSNGNSHGRWGNILLYGNEEGLRLGVTGAGVNVVENLAISNLIILGADAGGTDARDGLNLGAYTKNISISNLVVDGCSGIGVTTENSGEIANYIDRLTITDCNNAGGTGIGLRVIGIQDDKLIIGHLSFLGNDVDYSATKGQRGNYIKNETDNWTIDGDHIVFSKIDQTLPMTDNTAIDLFTITLPDTGPLGALIDLEYSLWGSNENVNHREKATFAVLYDGTNINASSVDVYSSAQALLGGITMTVTPAVATALGAGEATAVFSINQNNTANTALDIAITAKVTFKGTGHFLDNDPQYFAWNI